MDAAVRPGTNPASYIPILMAQAKIYWDEENYLEVENLFKKESVQYCAEHEVWQLNTAHMLFMEAVAAAGGVEVEAKYRQAIGFYEPIVKAKFGSILDISAIVLANLCVAYIMTSQNEQAEDLMRKIEKEEDVKSKIKLAAQRVLAGLSPEPEPEPVPMQPLDLAAANGATVVQAQKNGATLVTEVISDEQRAEELAEKRAREEKIALLEAKVEDGVEIKLQATRLFFSMARRGRRHRGDVDNSLVDFHTDR